MEEEKFTIDEIKNYILSQNSLKDVRNFLCVGNITNANLPKIIEDVEPVKKYVGEKSVDIYLLYCKETPNIYYVGRTYNIEKRFIVHLSNHSNHTSKLKHEWINYIKNKGYKLEYSILEVSCNYHASNDEYKHIEEFCSVPKNVVLNFNSSLNYSAENSIFQYRFNQCLYEKKTVIVDNYDDVSQLKQMNSEIVISQAEPNGHVFVIYCDETPNIFCILYSRDIQKRFNDVKLNHVSESGNFQKHEWIEYINKNGFELKYKVLESCPRNDLLHKAHIWMNKYIENPNNVLLNSITSHYNRYNKVFNARFKVCLYEKKKLIVDNYTDASQVKDIIEKYDIRGRFENKKT